MTTHRKLATGYSPLIPDEEVSLIASHLTASIAVFSECNPTRVRLIAVIPTCAGKGDHNRSLFVGLVTNPCGDDTLPRPNE